MPRSRIIAACAGSALAVAAALFAAPAAHATGDPSRYAGPKGNGNDCTKKDPCSLVTAINDAHGADTIVLLPGTYQTATSLKDNGENIKIEGATNEPFPVVESAAPSSGPGLELTGDSTLSHFRFVDTTANADGILGFTSTFTHMLIEATGVDANALVTHGSVVDSVVLSTASGGVALLDALPANSVDTSDTSTVDGDTIEAPGAAGEGLSAIDNSMAQLTVNTKDDIFHGGDDDIAASSDGYAATTVDVNVDYSDYATVSELAGLGPANVNHNLSDITTAPKFRDAAKYDFREAAGSATIDAGTSAGAGSTDLEGFPRTLGHSTDMGAYEFAEKAALKDLSVVKTEDHSAKLTVVVEPEGFTTDVRIIATHGSDRIPSKKVTVDDSVSSRKVTLTVDGLKKKTTYDVQAVGVNASGTYYSKRELLKTK